MSECLGDNDRCDGPSCLSVYVGRIGGCEAGRGRFMGCVSGNLSRHGEAQSGVVNCKG